MQFNSHLELAGRHSTLSPSSYHWINYDDEKFDATYKRKLAAMKGTQFHDLAHNLILMGVKLPRSQKTMSLYVNDAIGFRMKPEQVLCYSENSFGTADAISFRKQPNTTRMLLRIHDLKTGETPTAMHQLEVYVALFCLEYGVKPGEIDIELRIYQNDDIVIHIPELDEIVRIMGKIISFDKRIDDMKREAFGE